MGDNIKNVQFYENENICETILYYNKIYIQNYQNELNKIPKDLDKQIDNKMIELQHTITPFTRSKVRQSTNCQ